MPVVSPHRVCNESPRSAVSANDIGQPDASIPYSDRPTVKIIIKKDNTILLLNNGLLPGGGVDQYESDSNAISRELQEELGAIVEEIEEVGTVIQYRTFLHKRYVINGYTATLASIGGLANPQDTGESQFSHAWLTVDAALKLVSDSIQIAGTRPMKDDSNQGKLYNLMTTYELLKQVRTKGL